MIVRRIKFSLRSGTKTRDQLALMLKGKLRKSDIDEGIRLLRAQGLIRVSKTGKIAKVTRRQKK